MSLTDPIADMIARIKNGLMRSHKKIEMPASIFKTRILEVLKNEGFIIDYKIDVNESKKQNILIDLKYHYGNPVINNIERMDARKQKVGGEIICKVF